jgi:hypothetical protein
MLAFKELEVGSIRLGIVHEVHRHRRSLPRLVRIEASPLSRRVKSWKEARIALRLWLLAGLITMRNLSGSFEKSDSWQVAASAQSAISLAVRAMGGQIEGMQGENNARLSVGSRLAYRLLGFLTPARTMPMQINIEAVPVSSGILRLTVRASSDEGWSLIQVAGIAARLYQRAFDRRLRSVETAVSPFIVRGDS